MGGAKTPPIDDIIDRSKYPPTQMWTGWHARIISTISSSRLITIRGRALQDAEAQSSSTRQGKDSPRPRVALHWKSALFAKFFPVWARAPELSLNKPLRIAGRYFVRSPKIAVPIRTWVAPSAIAAAKSALIPIERSLRPLRFAIFAVSAK